MFAILRCSRSYCKSGQSTAGAQSYRARLLRLRSRRFNEFQTAHRAAQQDLGTRLQYSQINRALLQNGNENKILMLKPSSRVGFERPFKTASNVRTKFDT